MPTYERPGMVPFRRWENDFMGVPEAEGSDPMIAVPGH
jgi:hypothetical protein